MDFSWANLLSSARAPTCGNGWDLARQEEYLLTRVTHALMGFQKVRVGKLHERILGRRLQGLAARTVQFRLDGGSSLHAFRSSVRRVGRELDAKSGQMRGIANLTRQSRALGTVQLSLVEHLNLV